MIEAIEKDVGTNQTDDYIQKIGSMPSTLMCDPKMPTNLTFGRSSKRQQDRLKQRPFLEQFQLGTSAIRRSPRKSNILTPATMQSPKKESQPTTKRLAKHTSTKVDIKRNTLGNTSSALQNDSSTPEKGRLKKSDPTQKASDMLTKLLLEQQKKQTYESKPAFVGTQLKNVKIPKIVGVNKRKSGDITTKNEIPDKKAKMDKKNRFSDD